VSCVRLWLKYFEAIALSRRATCPSARLSAMICAMNYATDGITPLTASMKERVLRHFDLPSDPPPDLSTLRRLVERYTRTVPWESASRIVRRARHSQLNDCAVLGAKFWENTLNIGTGGTCFESNYSFFGLLRRLGYEGYLTINNMGDLTGCHTAIIILLQGDKYLVDVGLPIYAILPIRAGASSRAHSKFLTYSAEPLSDSRFEIWREPHPVLNAFTLIDRPIADAAYRRAAIADYQPGGYFLDKVVINKVIDEQLWRFNSDEQPFCLQQFVAGERHDHPLDDDPAGAVADKFGISQSVVTEAMSAIDR